MIAWCIEKPEHHHVERNRPTFNVLDYHLQPCRKDDTLPDRLTTEPIKAGASKGHLISRADLNHMLDEYYKARGWDPKTGIPTRTKLGELGLGPVADQLNL